MRKRGKKAQLTLFIILAILIVAITLLLILFWKDITGNRLDTDNPYLYIQECLEDYFEETIETISFQGGDYEINEEMSFFYRGEYIRFLCHTSENYRPCYKQYLFLIPHIEQQILTNIEDEVNICFDNLKANYERSGYEVVIENSKEKPLDVKIQPEFIFAQFGKELYLTKGGNNQEFDDFNLELESYLYSMLLVSENILTWENLFGDSLSEAYMVEDPYIKVEKRLKEDDIKIYTVSHRETGEKFRFATRSLALPPGF